ncbi:MAG TPA: hypothetical protein VFZ85_01960 [Jiangellaceae bacterium]
MRIRKRLVLLALAATAATVALSAGHAAAGGPTSVLVVNPTTGETGSLYAPHSDYQVLQSSLEPATNISVDPPPQLSGGPGTPAINITWLAHDVAVWRVDRVRLEFKEVWVQTNLMADGATPFDGGGEWHVAADQQAVLDVLDELGVLPGPDSADADKDGSLNGTGQLGTNGSATADDDPIAATSAPRVPGWQWIAAAAAGGIALGAAGRPSLTAVVRRRPAGPRQQLIDIEPPEDTDQISGQPDSNPAKAPALALDLGDLNPADLPR